MDQPIGEGSQYKAIKNVCHGGHLDSLPQSNSLRFLTFGVVAPIWLERSWGGDLKKRLGAGNLPVSPFLEVAPMIPSILQKVLRDRHLHLSAAFSISGLIFTLIDPRSHWAFTRDDHPE